MSENSHTQRIKEAAQQPQSRGWGFETHKLLRNSCYSRCLTTLSSMCAVCAPVLIDDRLVLIVYCQNKQGFLTKKKNEFGKK